jgi:putative transposase
VQAVGPVAQRRTLIGTEDEPSLRRQCELLEISRTAYYYEPCPETDQNLELMRRLDELHLENPVYGSRRLTVMLNREGRAVNRKRVGRLLRLMGIEAIHPRRCLSQPGEGHEIFPYLLKDVEINGPNQVWCSDITYIPMQHGFMYLVAVMDWWSRYVLSWGLSNTMESEFCIRAWEQALAEAGQVPLISNTDQGSQFTSPGFIDAVQSAGVEVSMDGRGRWIDNRFIERLWRSVKYEEVYLNDYGDGLSADRGLRLFFQRYNISRPHQALDNATPVDWYRSAPNYGGKPATWEAMRVGDKGRPRHTETLGPGIKWIEENDF